MTPVVTPPLVIGEFVLGCHIDRTSTLYDNLILMSKLMTQVKYAQVVRDIKTILERSRENADGAPQRQALEANWEVGRYLAEHLPLDESPNAKNARIITHLAMEFSQPKVYFHTAIKFYRGYPDAAPVDENFSWADYIISGGVTDSIGLN